MNFSFPTEYVTTISSNHIDITGKTSAGTSVTRSARNTANFNNGGATTTWSPSNNPFNPTLFDSPGIAQIYFNRATPAGSGMYTLEGRVMGGAVGPYQIDFNSFSSGGYMLNVACSSRFGVGNIPTVEGLLIDESSSYIQGNTVYLTVFSDEDIPSFADDTFFLIGVNYNYHAYAFQLISAPSGTTSLSNIRVTAGTINGVSQPSLFNASRSGSSRINVSITIPFKNNSSSANINAQKNQMASTRFTATVAYNYTTVSGPYTNSHTIPAGNNVNSASIDITGKSPSNITVTSRLSGNNIIANVTSPSPSTSYSFDVDWENESKFLVFKYKLNGVVPDVEKRRLIKLNGENVYPKMDLSNLPTVTYEDLAFDSIFSNHDEGGVYTSGTTDSTWWLATGISGTQIGLGENRTKVTQNVTESVFVDNLIDMILQESIKRPLFFLVGYNAGQKCVSILQEIADRKPDSADLQNLDGIVVMLLGDKLPEEISTIPDLLVDLNVAFIFVGTSVPIEALHTLLSMDSYGTLPDGSEAIYIKVDNGVFSQEYSCNENDTFMQEASHTSLFARSGQTEVPDFNYNTITPVSPAIQGGICSTWDSAGSPFIIANGENYGFLNDEDTVSKWLANTTDDEFAPVKIWVAGNENWSYDENGTFTANMDNYRNNGAIAGFSEDCYTIVQLSTDNAQQVNNDTPPASAGTIVINDIGITTSTLSIIVPRFQNENNYTLWTPWNDSNLFNVVLKNMVDGVPVPFEEMLIKRKMAYVTTIDNPVAYVSFYNYEMLHSDASDINFLYDYEHIPRVLELQLPIKMSQYKENEMLSCYVPFYLDINQIMSAGTWDDTSKHNDNYVLLD